MILSTKYLDNSRPFTKQVKNDKEKQWKKFEADVWKIFFDLTLAEWNHITPNIYYSTTSSWKFYFFGVRSQLPVFV